MFRKAHLKRIEAEAVELREKAEPGSRINLALLGLETAAAYMLFALEERKVKDAKPTE